MIKPTIKFFRKDVDYVANQIGEHGEPVSEDSSINSGRNDHFLDVSEIGNSTELPGPMIPYGRQDISAEDIEAVTEVLRSDWLTQGRPAPASSRRWRPIAAAAARSR